MLDDRLVQGGTGHLRASTHGPIGRIAGRLLGIPADGEQPADVVVAGGRVTRRFGRVRWSTRMARHPGGFTERFPGGLTARFDCTVDPTGTEFVLRRIGVGARFEIAAPRWITISGRTRLGAVPDRPSARRLVSTIHVVAPGARLDYSATIDRDRVAPTARSER